MTVAGGLPGKPVYQVLASPNPEQEAVGALEATQAEALPVAPCFGCASTPGLMDLRHTHKLRLSCASYARHIPLQVA